MQACIYHTSHRGAEFWQRNMVLVVRQIDLEACRPLEVRTTPCTVFCEIAELVTPHLELNRERTHVWAPATAAVQS
jgi:hypothetical protein